MRPKPRHRLTVTVTVTVRLDVMCGKKDRKKTFFPFLFFTVFVQKCFERHWTLCREKKFAKSLGVLEGWPEGWGRLGGVPAVTVPSRNKFLNFRWTFYVEKNTGKSCFSGKNHWKKSGLFLPKNFANFFGKTCFANFLQTLRGKKNWKNCFSQKKGHINVQPNITFVKNRFGVPLT